MEVISIARDQGKDDVSSRDFMQETRWVRTAVDSTRPTSTCVVKDQVGMGRKMD